MIRWILLSLLSIFLLGCDDDPFPRCVAADDFIGSGLTISAYISKGSEKFKADDGGNSDGFHPNQVARWKDTGYITTGHPIIVRTEGIWTAWSDMGNQVHSKSSSDISDNFNTGSKYKEQLGLSSVPQDRICKYLKKDPLIQGCSAISKVPYVDFGKVLDNPSAGEYGPPCWFKNGYGAYLLLKRPTDPDPNKTLDIMRYPRSPIIHLGYDVGAGQNEFSSISHPIIDNQCNQISIERGWKIYTKILDRYYWNNAGGYGIQFIKGAVEDKGRKILENLRQEVLGILMGGAESIFKRITSNNVYIDFIKALLILYIAFTGIAYMFGMVQQAYSDVLIRIIKIAVIIQLISPYSWEFFYSNFAILFVDGTAQLIGIINSHSGVEYDNAAPFAAFDRMLDIFFSKTVWSQRMPALIWSRPPVIILFVLLAILIILIAYVFIMIYACIIYLTSMIGVIVLISLMPILFITLLFSKLPNTFDNWLKQAMSFAFQSIMVFTFVSLFASLVMNFFYRTFGYTTCYNKTVKFELCLFSLGCFEVGSGIHSWTFGDKFDYYKLGTTTDLAEKDHRTIFSNGFRKIKVPPDYKEEDYRYIDYPFFDPNPDNINPHDEKNNHGYDYDIIQNQIKKDQFVIFPELFALILLTMLLWHLRLFVQRLGASIAGASPFLTVVGNTFENFFVAKADSIAAKPGQVILGGMHLAKQAWSSTIGQIYDVPDRVTRSIPGVNTLVSGIKKAYNVAEWSIGAESEEKAQYREQDAFKWIHHKQAVIGQTLSNIAPDNLVKAGLSYGYNRAFGNADESLVGHVKKSYAQQLEKLHDNIIGYRRPGAPTYEGNLNDNLNPFQRSDALAPDDNIDDDDVSRPEDISEDASFSETSSLSNVGSDIADDVIDEDSQLGDEGAVSSDTSDEYFIHRQEIDMSFLEDAHTEDEVETHSINSEIDQFVGTDQSGIAEGAKSTGEQNAEAEQSRPEDISEDASFSETSSLSNVGSDIADDVIDEDSQLGDEGAVSSDTSDEYFMHRQEIDMSFLEDAHTEDEVETHSINSEIDQFVGTDQSGIAEGAKSTGEQNAEAEHFIIEETQGRSMINDNVDGTMESIQGDHEGIEPDVEQSYSNSGSDMGESSDDASEVVVSDADDITEDQESSSDISDDYSEDKHILESSKEKSKGGDFSDKYRESLDNEQKRQENEGMEEEKKSSRKKKKKWGVDDDDNPWEGTV